MNITGSSARYELSATATNGSVNTVGNVQLGTSSKSIIYDTPPDMAYSFKLTIPAAKTLMWDLATASFESLTFPTQGVKQVETATIVAASGATVAGTLIVTATSDDFDTIVIPVSLELTDNTASLVAEKVRAQLAAITAITDLYTVGGAGATYSLTRNEAKANDSELNLEHINGTCSGITASSTSTDTTVGVYPYTVTRLNGADWDGTDFEGRVIPASASTKSVLIRVISGSVKWYDNDYTASIVIGDTMQEGQVSLRAGSSALVDTTSQIFFDGIEDAVVLVDFQGSTV